MLNLIKAHLGKLFALAFILGILNSVACTSDYTGVGDDSSAQVVIVEGETKTITNTETVEVEVETVIIEKEMVEVPVETPVSATPTKEGEVEIEPSVECKTNEECEDYNSCTIDSCDNNECVHSQVDCHDNNECTADSCDEASGCQNFASMVDGDSCDDGNLCTNVSFCFGGKCIGELQEKGIKLPCDDGNVCTMEFCNFFKQKCQSDGTKDCDDSNPNTIDSCDKKSGNCKNVEVCKSNYDCDDGKFCTFDYCLPKKGCVHEQDKSCINSGLCETDLDCKGSSWGEYCIMHNGSYGLCQQCTAVTSDKSIEVGCPSEKPYCGSGVAVESEDGKLLATKPRAVYWCYECQTNKDCGSNEVCTGAGACLKK